MLTREIEKTLICLEYLEDNWDGYESPNPTHLSVERARSFLSECQYEPNDIGPDTLGGVGVVFVFEDDIEINIMFLNSGRTLVVTIIGDDICDISNIRLD